MVSESLEVDREHLKSLPDIDTMKTEAEYVRRTLLEKFSGKKRLHEMPYDDKRKLFHLLFNGKDHTGARYGIYVDKIGKRQQSKVD